MSERKYVSASDAAEVLSEKLSVPIADLVDLFAELPSAELKQTSLECKRCGETIRFPIAFYDSFYELAAGAVMEKICDKYCRFPGECSSQEELDKHCDGCEVVELLDLIFKKKKEKP